MSGKYISRPLGKNILSSKKSVAILEGARAVGKTMLAHEELERNGYRYYTLADDRTYKDAQANPSSWVGALTTPAVIDEAQRVNGLPLAIKEVVDAANYDRPQFILTGSASLGRSGLDGQDPLTRRAQRFTLHPFTRRELANVAYNLVDDLWDATPREDFSDRQNRHMVFLDMLKGGFPAYALSGSVFNPERHIANVLDDIDSVLGDALLPDERFDGAISRAILNKLLSQPGGILNVSRIGNELGHQDRTVNSYISMFLRRFLVRSLPNLNQKAGKQSFTRSKMHPIDTSFSIAAMMNAGLDVEADAKFGEVLESYVVAQVVPDVQTASKRTECFYWREAGRSPKEVDIVLKRGEQLLGIEVKSSATFSDADLRGLRALSNDRRFVRGYVVYMGSETVRVSDRIWAIPLSSLYSQQAFERNETSQKNRKETGSMGTSSSDYRDNSSPMVDANIFLSYHHADNDHLDGMIVDLMREVVREYEFQFGSTLSLFVDSDSIKWGDDWRHEIRKNIEATTFIVPALTPRYIRSSACREEISQFLSYTSEMPGRQVLTLVWQPVEKSGEMEGDSILDAILGRQYEEVHMLRDLDPKDPEYRKVVRHLAARMREAVQENRDAAASRPEQQGDEDVDSEETLEDLLEKLGGLNEDSEKFNEKAGAFVESLTQLVNYLGENPVPANGDAKAYKAWSLRVASETKENLHVLNASSDDIGSFWMKFMDTVDDATRLYSRLPIEQQADCLDSLSNTLYSMKASFSGLNGVEALELQFNMIRMLSPRLKPLSEGFVKALRLVQDMTNALDSRIQMVDDLRAMG